MKFSETREFSPATGETIYRRFFEPLSTKHSGEVLMLHGLGDHIGCHDWAAGLLIHAGFAPIGFDWPGHGQSSGRRGDIPGVRGAMDLIDETVGKMKSQPVGVFTHSTGGFILLHYLDRKQALEEQAPFRWLWLNSPLLQPGYNQSAFKQKMAKWLGLIAPRAVFSTGVVHEQCCHMEGADENEERLNFEGCQNRVSLRYGNSLIDYGESGFHGAIPLSGSTRFLLTQGDEDTVCPPFLAKQFFDNAPVTDKTFALIRGARHEAFREVNPLPFYNSARAWLMNTASH